MSSCSWPAARSPGSKEGTLGTLDFEKLPKPAGPAPATREERDRYSVTVRLRVTDDRGLVAESRRSFFVLNDPSWMESFPLNVGASGEAVPGRRRSRRGRPGRDHPRDGRWNDPDPQVGELRSSRAAPPPRSRAAARRRSESPRETVIREPVVADILGRGEMAIVAASREGKVYAFNARGERLKGFPVSVRPGSSRPAAPTQLLESGNPLEAGSRGPGWKAGQGDHRDRARWERLRLAGRRQAARRIPGRGRRSRGPVDDRSSSPHRRSGDIDGDGRPEIVFGSNGVTQGSGGRLRDPRGWESPSRGPVPHGMGPGRGPAPARRPPADARHRRADDSRARRREPGRRHGGRPSRGHRIRNLPAGSPARRRTGRSRPVFARCPVPTSELAGDQFSSEPGFSDRGGHGRRRRDGAVRSAASLQDADHVDEPRRPDRRCSGTRRLERAAGARRPRRPCR